MVVTRLMGVFNQIKVDDTPTYTMPAGLWLGAALNISRTHGRAWGINLATVTGNYELRHTLPRGSANLGLLDAQGVSSLAIDDGKIKIIGDEFAASQDTDPRRFWPIARVVDYVQRVLTEQADAFIGSTRSATRVANRLTLALSDLVTSGEIISATVTPEPGRGQGLQKYFVVDLELQYATNVLNLKLRFAL